VLSIKSNDSLVLHTYLTLKNNLDI